MKGRRRRKNKTVTERLRQKKQQKKIPSENFAILLGMNLRRDTNFLHRIKHGTQQRQKLEA